MKNKHPQNNLKTTVLLDGTVMYTERSAADELQKIIYNNDQERRQKHKDAYDKGLLTKNELENLLGKEYKHNPSYCEGCDALIGDGHLCDCRFCGTKY